MSGSDHVASFLHYMTEQAPAFADAVLETQQRQPDLFQSLAEPMLAWAEQVIGPTWREVLVDGYMAFVIDVNMSQAKYEKRGRYEFSSYSEVFSQTYDDAEFMSNYHWGVYVTTFAWEHHLLLHDFFLRHFIAPLKESTTAGGLLDLGCGSGIWSMLALRHLTDWRSTMVDISATTVGLTRQTLDIAGFGARTEVHEHDALTFDAAGKCDAAISCFLMEHLETPEALLGNLAASLEPRKLAFVSTALTAAETDHIYEFRRESEVILLAEKAGFRVVGTYSSAPRRVSQNNVFLPRSMALVLQKRSGEIW